MPSIQETAKAIFDNSTPEQVSAHIRELTIIAQQAVARKKFQEWQSTSPEAQRLGDEWVAQCAAQAKDEVLHLSTRLRNPTDPTSPTVYAVRGTHGHHWSEVSHEAALQEMVNDHRTGIEDLEETRMKMAFARDSAHAIELAAQLSTEVARENPGVTGEERDALVMAKIAERNQAHAVALAVAEKGESK